MQTDHLSVIHTCSSDDTAACLGMVKGLFHCSSSLMSGYFVRNEDQRVKDVKGMYLYARCSKRHLAFFFRFSYHHRCFPFCYHQSSDRDGLHLQLPPTILSSDFGPHLFIFLYVCFCPPQTSSLQYLEARNTPLLDHSAPFVARALRISGSLAVLHLENAGLSGRPLMLLGKTFTTPSENILLGLQPISRHNRLT